VVGEQETNLCPEGATHHLVRLVRALVGAEWVSGVADGVAGSVAASDSRGETSEETIAAIATNTRRSGAAATPRFLARFARVAVCSREFDVVCFVKHVFVKHVVVLLCASIRACIVARISVAPLVRVDLT
jgi:hypothetical protein